MADDHIAADRMYRALRAGVRAGLYLYCGRIRVDLRSAPPSGAVLLLASNHPNSFFDALLIATHLPYRMRFLARGDAFRDPRAAKVLRALFMIPIYRMSEGRSELKRTSQSFEQAQEDLERGGSVLVFSEGLSLNEPGLRPLGKGTARIAYRAWNAGLDVQVLPVWLRYNGFHQPFMDVSIATGEVMRKGAPDPGSEAVFLHRFNATLRERLLQTSSHVDDRLSDDRRARSGTKRALRQMMWAPLAFIGLLLHAPWFFLLRAVTVAKTQGTVFFDPVLFCLLFLTYPIWLFLLVGASVWAGTGYLSLAMFALAPLSLIALRGFRMR